MFYQLLLSVSVLVFNVNARPDSGYCTAFLKETAKCTSIWECKTLLPLFRLKSRTAEQTQFLHSFRCGIDSLGTLYICCGTNITIPDTRDTDVDTPYPPNPLLPNRHNCGFQNHRRFKRIIGGEATALDEFPWMVIIQYVKPSGEKKFACSGSLINPRYVLTAANCVTGDVLAKLGQVTNVRLGEYDTSSPARDCITFNNITTCNQEEVTVGIDEVIPHPGFPGNNNSLLHDIALVRLTTEVKYSEYIQPVCLPLPNETSSPGDKLIVAGWGKTEKGISNVKLKVQVPVVSESQCADIFRPFRIHIGNSVLCAGGEEGKDSCTGDIGGPLMRTLPTDETRWMAEGIASFGNKRCGTAGYPGVYTRIAKYVPWIHKNIRA